MERGLGEGAFDLFSPSRVLPSRFPCQQWWDRIWAGARERLGSGLLCLQESQAAIALGINAEKDARAIGTMRAKESNNQVVLLAVGQSDYERQ